MKYLYLNKRLSVAKLTGKQERFCQEYIIDWNATQAYIRAGYKAKNDNVAKATASKLLTKPNIKSRIDELKAEIKKLKDIDTAQIVDNLIPIASSNLHDFLVVGDDGRLSYDVFKHDGRAIQSIDIEDYTDMDGELKQRVKIKLWDKNKANDQLARYTGAYEKDNMQAKDMQVVVNVNKIKKGGE